jgi:hypothetical protein
VGDRRLDEAVVLCRDAPHPQTLVLAQLPLQLRQQGLAPRALQLCAINLKFTG